MERKIIQVTSSSSIVENKMLTRLVALCDDGTLWSLLSGRGETWTPIPGVPQPEEAKS